MFLTMILPSPAQQKQNKEIFTNFYKYIILPVYVMRLLFAKLHLPLDYKNNIIIIKKIINK